MNRSNWHRLGTLAVVAVGVLSFDLRGANKVDRAAFMREKLEHSKQILDGLVREDFSRIKSDALALRAMKEAPEWTRLSHPEAGRYAIYSLEFRTLADELVARADARDLDAASRAYGRLIENCVNCHKELRRGR